MLTHSVSEAFSVTPSKEYSWYFSFEWNLTEQSSPRWIIDGFIAQVESSRPSDCRDNDAEAGAREDTPEVISTRRSKRFAREKEGCTYWLSSPLRLHRRRNGMKAS